MVTDSQFTAIDHPGEVAMEHHVVTVDNAESESDDTVVSDIADSGDSKTLVKKYTAQDIIDSK